MALASPAWAGVHFFLFVVTTSFIATILWIFIYLLGIREALNIPINWILSEFLNTGIITVFYCIAFIVQLISSISYSHHGTYIAAAVFGFINACVYALATYLLHIEWKSSRTTN